MSALIYFQLIAVAVVCDIGCRQSFLLRVKTKLFFARKLRLLILIHGYIKP